MKRIALILFMMMSTAATAQKLTVVVGAVGEDPKPGLRKALETQIKAAFVKDGRYTAVTREEAVMGAVDSEQAHQRTGAVDDNQIRQLGKQTGARYVCVVEIAPLMNSYTLTAQFVDIVSADIVNIASVPNQLRNPGDFLTASEELVRKLLGYAETPAAAAKKVPMKFIAVIGTQIDTLSIAANEISRADLDEITSVLRREAVNNLPRDRFNVMTSETVQSMGTAMVEDCTDETCIITLGSKIGADYIVQGTLSKVRGRLSLTVVIFETEYGNLVAVTPEPIRTVDFDELLDKILAGSAAMYKRFAGAGAVPQATVPALPDISAPPAAAPQTAAPPAPDVPPPVTYTLSVKVKPNNGGTVKRAPNQTYYDAGTKVSAVAVPAEGYKFKGWSGASLSIYDSITVTVNRDLTLSAYFVKKIRDIYFSAKWMPPVTPETKCGWAFDLEVGRIYRSGLFWGIDAGGGVQKTLHFMMGGSASMGHTIDLSDELKFAYGVSVGPWRAAYHTDNWDVGGFGGPFVKLRKKFLEVTYRGIIGEKVINDHIEDGIGYISQLMLGVHFQTDRNKR